MIMLAARMLRRRIGSATATLVALALGVIILSALGAMVESGVRYKPGPGEYTGADLVVANRSLPAGDGEIVTLPEGGTVPADLTDRVRRIAGVEAAAADTRVPMPGATGRGWSVAAFVSSALVAGTPPAGPDDVVLDARLAGDAEPGDSTSLVVGGVAREFRVSGLATSGVFFTDARAAELAGKPGRVDAIGVRTTPGADLARIRAEIGTPTYLATELRDTADENAPARELMIGIGTSLGGYVAMLVAFVVAGTIGLSVRHRRRDLALLRAIAATPGQVRLMIVAEAGLIGVAAAAIGVPAGIAATSWTHGQFVDRGFLPAGFPMVPGVYSSLVAVLAIVLVAMLSALIAARRITRIRPSEALGEAAVEPASSGVVRGLFGLLAAVGTGLTGAFAVGADAETALGNAMGMLFLSITTVALLGPWINRAAARLLSPALRAIWGDSGYLAGRNLMANAQGMTTVLTALVLAVGFGGSVWFLQDNLHRQTLGQTRAGTLADHALISPAGLPTDAATEARAIPGVRSVTSIRHTSVIIGGLALPAQAIDGAGAIDPGVTSGSLDDLGDDGMAISALQAGSSGWAVGDRAELWLGDGTPVTLRVAAVYQRALGFGDVLLPRQVVDGHTARDLDDRLLIRGTVDDARLAALSARYPGSAVAAAVDLDRQLTDGLAVNAWLNKLLIGVMVAYAVLAAANTMVMAALARRRELSLLRLAGVTSRQVKRMVHAEQTGLLGVALVIGGGIAAGTLIAVVNALTGDPVPYVPPLGWVAVLGGTTVLAMATTVLPVGRLLRIPPVESIGIRE